MSQSILEQEVRISPRAASITKPRLVPFPDSSGTTLLVLPVSRQATRAQVSRLSTSHFFKLLMTLLLSPKLLCAHSESDQALLARFIFSEMSNSESAGMVARW